jgi:hypothetical protein
MMRRSLVARYSAFEALALRAQFRDRIAVSVRAPPEALSHALHEVTLRDMKLAGSSASSAISRDGWLITCPPSRRDGLCSRR